MTSIGLCLRLRLRDLNIKFDYGGQVSHSVIWLAPNTTEINHFFFAFSCLAMDIFTYSSRTSSFPSVEASL